MSEKENKPKTFRKRSEEAENAYEGVNVLSKTISTGMEILVSTSQYESVRFSGKREIVVEGNLTDEQEYEIHKDLFLDCAADIVAAGHSVFKQWNRMPKTGWPPKLGEKLIKPGGEVHMDSVEVEEKNG